MIAYDQDSFIYTGVSLYFQVFAFDRIRCCRRWVFL